MLWPGEDSFGKSNLCWGCGESGASSFNTGLGASVFGVGALGCGSGKPALAFGTGALGNSFTGRSGCGAGAGVGWTGGATSRKTRGSTFSLGKGCTGRVGGFDGSNAPGGSSSFN